jgi:hypothetical protein
MAEKIEAKEDFTPLYKQLVEIEKSNGSLDDLGEVISKFPHLYSLPPSPHLLECLQESQAAKGIPVEKMWFPKLHGTFIENGYAPALFTTVEFAQHIARINGHIPNDSSILIQGMATAYMLMERLVAGAAGIILDGGQVHKTCLNSIQLSRVAAIANRKQFANTPELIVLRNKNGQPVFVTEGVTQILVFDEGVDSDVIKEFLYSNFGISDIIFSIEPTSAILRDGLAAGAQQLTVNPGLVSCRVYSESELNSMLAT